MLTPTEAQVAIRDHEALALLVIAPAGCGKTEALALRVQGLLRRGVIAAPKRILVTTFSNRARDNIKERLRSYLQAAELRERVTVVNFHGLSARIYRAHADVIGLDPNAVIPDGDWVGEQVRRRALPYTRASAAQTALRTAKQSAADDDAVADLLNQSGNADAVEIENQRRAENRLTYDDLPRLAELILGIPAVSELYDAHFGAVVVDEFQDLTPQQFRIVQSFGTGKSTYAGDLAQGIYGFAGARPQEIDALIREECDDVVEFAESHRSSPAVLAAVNALSDRTGGSELTCAAPGEWPGGGLAALVQKSSVEAEAAWIAKLCRSISSRAPEQRIGVITRSGPRRRFIDAAMAAETELPIHRWDDGVLDTDTARRVRAMLSSLNVEHVRRASDKVEYLRSAADFDLIQDPSDRVALADAINWCIDLLGSGLTADEIAARVRVGDSATLLTRPGVHLLTGHIGKGQQFDWVIVAGAEQDTIPSFQATTDDQIREEARVLSVMISRARHGVVITYSDTVPTAAGAVRSRRRSSFLDGDLGKHLVSRESAVQWLREADWARIAAK